MARRRHVVEATDPARYFEQLATSQEPFDVEFRAFIQDVSGILTQPMPAPLPELLLDWVSTPTTAQG